MTSRCPNSATGFSANTCGVMSALSSSTTRRKPSAGCADADGRDVRIGRLHARRELVQLARALDSREVEHEAAGVAQHDELMLDRRCRLEDDARVFLRGPKPGGRDPRRVGPRGRGEPLRGRQQHPAKRAAALDRHAIQPVSRAPRASAVTHRSPFGVCAIATTSRPPSPVAYASDNARSGAGSRSPTRSGHSTMQTASSRK